MLAGTLTVAGGLAWACTNFLRIDTVNPASAEPLSKTVVHGLNAPAGASVELRWNTVTGTPLARTQTDTSGAFSAEVQVPNVSPGIYVVVASTSGFTSRAPIQVGVGATGPSPAFTSTPSSNDGISPLVMGTGVLAVGLVALAMGTLGVSTRRRRVAVGVRTSPAASAERLEELV